MYKKFLVSVAKVCTTKIVSPWDRIALAVLIILLSLPVFYLLFALGLFIWSIGFSIFSLMSVNFIYGLGVFELLILMFVSLVILLIYFVLTKNNSIAKFINLAAVIIIFELIAYTWLNSWRGEHILNSVTGPSVDPIVNIEYKTDLILGYTKAIFQTLILSLILFVVRKK